MLQLPWTVLLQHSHSLALIMLLLGAAESCATHSGGIRQSSFCPFDFIIGPAVELLLINKYKHSYQAKLRWCLG